VTGLFIPLSYGKPTQASRARRKISIRLIPEEQTHPRTGLSCSLCCEKVTTTKQNLQQSKNNNILYNLMVKTLREATL